MSILYKILRLIFALLMLITIWITTPWFTISYVIFQIDITNQHLFILWLFIYILLEYRYYKNFKLYNVYYHIVFWVLIFIMFISLSMGLYYLFIVDIEKITDLILNRSYFKLKINCSSNYMIYYTYKNAINIINLLNFDNPDIVKILHKLIQHTNLYHITASMKTLEEVREIFYDYLIFILKLEALQEYNAPKHSPSIFIKIFKFIFILKTTCYIIPQIIMNHIPRFILSKIFSEQFENYARDILEQTFILEMDYSEVKNLTQDFMRWLLNNNSPLVILCDMLKSWFL